MVDQATGDGVVPFEAQRRLAFVHEIDQLKTVVQHLSLLDLSRRKKSGQRACTESDAACGSNLFLDSAKIALENGARAGRP